MSEHSSTNEKILIINSATAALEVALDILCQEHSLSQIDVLLSGDSSVQSNDLPGGVGFVTLSSPRFQSDKISKAHFNDLKDKSYETVVILYNDLWDRSYRNVESVAREINANEIVRVDQNGRMNRLNGLRGYWFRIERTINSILNGAVLLVGGLMILLFYALTRLYRLPRIVGKKLS